MKSLGSSSGFIAIGEVVNHEDDPSQSGRVRVKWLTGSAVQDQVGDDDLPWTQSMFPSTNPNLGQTGGPHTGLRKGSRVVGIPLDGQGQDFLIIGSLVKGGGGGQEEPGRFDSDIPQAAKEREKGGEAQPRFGDVNGVVCQTSIIEYGEQEGGKEKRPAQYCSLDDSVGLIDEILK